MKDERPRPIVTLPLPPSDPSFVRRVMARLPRVEVFSWRQFWKVPALGLGLAAVLFAVLVKYEQPTFTNDDTLDEDQMMAMALEEL